MTRNRIIYESGMNKNSELKRYLRHLKFKENEWENLCIKCGACCGAYDDPCRHLKKSGNNKFYCRIYSNRLGTRKTIGGEEFDCVLVKEIMYTYWKNDCLCACKKYLKMPLSRKKNA